ncbi:MAG: zinc ABC transporter substrate-binding protein [Candidatus Parabeggiatoa sp.]|nr:zinc ABC transporter substrate-binding protein [Candidatus Parabeggiatoa sp.]
MKKITIILFISLLTFIFSHSAQAKLKVFACEPEWGALAEEIGGEALKIYVATTGKQDPHYIQARPSLLAKARRAELLFCTGAELEIGWLPLLLRKTGNWKIRPGQPGHFMATDYVVLRDKPRYLDRSEGDIHPAGNPHVHLNPHNITRIAEALATRLAKLDPNNAWHYQTRHQDFVKRWEEAIEGWEAQAMVLKDVPIVVHHKSWVYLEQWLGLKQIAALEAKPGIPPSGSYLASVLNQLRYEPAKMVIYAAYQNPRSARWLSRRTGLPVVELPFTVGGTTEATDLFSLFDDTLKRLQDAIK